MKTRIFRKSIFFRSFFYLLALAFTIIVTITVLMIPREQNILLQSMESQARSLSASIAEVCGNAFVIGDYSFIVDHNMQVIQGSPDILYIIVARNNGLSMIHTSDNWQQINTPDPQWAVGGNKQALGDLRYSPLAKVDVYHYSFPLRFSGIDWGMLYIGLSLKHYREGLSSIYKGILWLSLSCFAIAISLSYFFAKQLANPILLLRQAAEKIIEGDLSARAKITSGDEVEELANSFNQMTEKIQISQKEILSARDYITNIIKSMSESLIVTDIELKIKIVNRATQELLGYKEDELIGKHINILFNEENIFFTQSSFDELMKNQFIHNREIVCSSKSDRLINALLSGSLLYDKDGKVQDFVFILLDITERKSAEEAMKKASEEAERANRAKSQFLAKMSHEIRTPMNGILGMIELLLDSNLNEKQQYTAQTAHQSGETLLSIINDILDFSKIEAGKLTLENDSFDLHKTIKETIRLFSERAHQKGLGLTCHIERDVPTTFYGDQVRLRQVLVNLLGNAIKFTDQGEVGLRVLRDGEKDDEVTICFEVSDNGIGIPLENQSDIFSSFIQADSSTARKYGGSGLGLAISKQLVEIMRGTITFQSTKGKGSIFWVRIPLKKYEGVQKTSISQKDIRDLRTLIVDDNDTNRAILTQQVLLLGIHSNVAENAQIALEMLKVAAIQGEPYDLVLLDMNMPDMDGVALARAITADPSIASVRLVLLSSETYYQAKEAYRAGIEYIISKPVQLSEFYNCLISLSGKRPDISSLETTQRMKDRKVRVKANILIAEDNPVNMEVIREMIEGCGCKVDTASSGKDALDLFTLNSYDLIFMDCHMPQMDGFDATSAIRKSEERNPRMPSKHASNNSGNFQVPIIALTADATMSSRERCLSIGMNDYVLKPYTKSRILDTLIKWLPGKCAFSYSDGDRQDETMPLSDSARGITSCDNNAININTLNSIRDLQKEGSPDILSHVINLYLTDAPKFLNKIQEAIKEGDAKALREIAHAFKSSSANLGADGLASHLKTLEDMGRSNSLESAETIFFELETEFRKVFTVLTNELN